MGLITINCTTCNTPHLWFTDNPDQRCQMCSSHISLTQTTGNTAKSVTLGQMCPHGWALYSHCEQCSLKNKLEDIVDELKNLFERITKLENDI